MRFATLLLACDRMPRTTDPVRVWCCGFAPLSGIEDEEGDDRIESRGFLLCAFVGFAAPLPESVCFSGVTCCEPPPALLSGAGLFFNQGSSDRLTFLARAGFLIASSVGKAVCVPNVLFIRTLSGTLFVDADRARFPAVDCVGSLGGE